MEEKMRREEEEDNDEEGEEAENEMWRGREGEKRIFVPCRTFAAFDDSTDGRGPEEDDIL